MTEENHGFDFETALRSIQEGKPLLGKEGILTPLIKNLTEAALEGELDSHLGQEITANRRNGKSRKTIKSLNGNFVLTSAWQKTHNFQKLLPPQTSLMCKVFSPAANFEFYRLPKQ